MRYQPKRLSILVAAVLAALLLLAGCSGGSAGGAGSGQPDPNGILRVGAPLASMGEAVLDPADSKVNTDEGWMSLIYGTLLRPTPEGELKPWLAKSVEVVDKTTVAVELREGISFSDGAPYDAEAVRAGILRTLKKPTSPAVTAGQHSMFSALSDIEIVGPLRLTFTLNRPVAGEFLAVLAGREASVPSPKAVAAGKDLNTSPIGAGPYLLERYRPGQEMVLKKNPDFVDADKWLLAGITFVNNPGGPAGTSALMAGTVDIITAVLPSDAAAIQADSRFEVLRHYTDFSYSMLNLCSTKAPFDDVRIRQALQHAIDRKELNELWLQGEGTPASGFWQENSKNFDPAVADTATYDPERAKALLAEAGAAKLEIDLWYPAVLDQRLMEIVQGQLGEIGVRVKLRAAQDIVSEFIEPQKPGFMVVPGSRSSVDKINRLFQPKVVQNLCGAQRPEIASRADQIAALAPDSPKRAELWKEIDRINAEQAYVIPTVWMPEIVAVNRERVGGDLRFTETRSPHAWMSYDTIFVQAQG